MRILLAALLVSTMFFAGMARAAEPPHVLHRLGNWRVYGDGPHYLDLGLGAFAADDGDADQSSAAARVELRIGRKLLFLGPVIGFLANRDGGYFAYGGLYADLAYRKLVLTPGAAAGGYEEGDGKDLGGTFQFRTSLAVAYQFDNLSRLGLQIAHISHLDIYEKNPGEEEIFLTLGIPF